MNKKSIFGRFFASVALVFAFICLADPSVHAADVPDYRLQVSPTFADLPDLVPGKTYDGTFKVENTGQKEIRFEIDTSPYSIVNGGKDDQNYTIDSTSNTSYTRLEDWINLSQASGTLPAGESTEIKYTIKIPADAAGGGQYALINIKMLQDEGTTEGASISAVKQIGFRVLTNIVGDVDKSGKILEQNINSILFNPPITATSTVENTGNTHIQASYILQVYPLGSNEEVYTNEESPTTVTILPETQRFNSIAWDGAPALGIFRVVQTVSIANQTETYEKVVFLCPIWLLFIVLLLIFFMVFWIVSRVKNRK